MAGQSAQNGNDILLLTYDFYDTGSLHGREVQELVKLCVKQNYTLTIISLAAPQKDKWHKGQYRHIGLGCAVEKPGLISVMKANILLKMTLFKLDAHKAIITDAAAFPCAFTLNKWGKGKTSSQIYWAHKVYPESYAYEGHDIPSWFEGRWKKRLKQLMKNMQCTVTNSLAVYKYLSHNGLDTRRLKVIKLDEALLSLDVSKKKASTKKSVIAPAAADKLKRDPIGQKFRLLYSGQILKGKALATLLNVAQKLEENNPEIEFVFSGFGSGVEWLRGERDKRQLHNIKLMPLQPAPTYRQFLESGDVHLALQDDGMGNVLSFINIEQSFVAQRPCLYVGDARSENALALKKAESGVVLDSNDELKLLKTILAYRNDADMWFAAHEKAKAINIAAGKKPQDEWAALLKKAIKG